MSVVKYKDFDGQYVVRFRLLEDAQKVQSVLNVANVDKQFLQIVTTDDSDYRYRILMHKDLFVNLVSHIVDDLDYTNFKDEVLIGDGGIAAIRSDWYNNVWVEGRAAQNADCRLLEHSSLHSNIYNQFIDYDSWPVLLGITNKVLPIVKGDKKGWGYCISHELRDGKHFVAVAFGKDLLKLNHKIDYMEVSKYPVEKLIQDGWIPYKHPDKFNVDDPVMMHEHQLRIDKYTNVLRIKKKFGE